MAIMTRSAELEGITPAVALFNLLASVVLAFAGLQLLGLWHLPSLRLMLGLLAITTSRDLLNPAYDYLKSRIRPRQ